MFYKRFEERFALEKDSDGYKAGATHAEGRPAGTARAAVEAACWPVTA